MFTNRIEAGEKLGIAIKDRKFNFPVVFGIPRGGVIVASEVAKIINAPISIVVPRKIGAPFNKEFAIGAVAPDGTLFIDEFSARAAGADKNYIEEESKLEIEESKRRLKEYGFKLPETLKGHTAIVIDDGVATGHTMIAALSYLKKLNPDQIVAAVPVAPQDTVEKLGKYADEVIVLYTPLFFSAVGEFYIDFHQVSDEEVKLSIHGIRRFSAEDD